LVGTSSYELVEFINISLKIAPDKVRFSICLSTAEFELFGNKEDSFFIRCRKD
jgi:hypothetical protein